VICWFCHWGWAKPVQDIYEKYKALVGEHALKYGHTHIVWEDENFDDDCVTGCIGEYKYADDDSTEEDLKLIDESLRELLLVPKKFREFPAEYDGDNPAAYPPPEGYFG
jgi:hypothetical protein